MQSNKQSIKLAILGHLSSGKNTLVGRILIDLSKIPQEEFDKANINESGANPKYSNPYSRLIHTRRILNHNGIPKPNSIETKNFQVSLDNIVGTNNFLKVLMTGQITPNAAIVIISALPEEYESSLSFKGEIYGQLLIAYALGIKQLIFCVNKMDEETTNWSDKVYDQLRDQVYATLKNIGYNPEKVPFIPISALQGDNINEISKKSEWYKGPTLIELIDSLELPKPLSSLPLRLPIQDIYKFEGNEKVIVGRIETGIMKKDMKLAFAPGNITSKVSSIEKYHESLIEALPEDNIGFQIKEKVGLANLKRGCVCGDADNDPPKISLDFSALIIILNYPYEINVEFTPVVDCHTAHFTAKFEKIMLKFDKLSGNIIEENPNSLANGDIALIKFVPLKEVCVEAYREYPALGRFGLRSHPHGAISVGIVSQVRKE